MKSYPVSMNKEKDPDPILYELGIAWTNLL